MSATGQPSDPRHRGRSLAERAADALGWQEHMTALQPLRGRPAVPATLPVPWYRHQTFEEPQTWRFEAPAQPQGGCLAPFAPLTAHLFA